MPIATKQQLIALRSPGPLIETLQLDGTEMHVAIKGVVRSAERESVYNEITEMSGLKNVLVEGERIPVTEDDIVAACWAAKCVRSPVLTSMEWLIFGASNSDMLASVGYRSLVCSRLAADDNTPDGSSAASLSLTENHDPLAFLPSSSA